ncbi:Lrp/AsnC family transcriptional regulator [Jiangella alba]|uniref:Lrp/AsnC family transcriptional regulator, regulator for asnA, asnC and gidA n=1 Tax=Jiangella alba TaxID=561176 RepID=A0A1H5PE53_9ACTN|nr:Lrp/AsnC family transcriptional regulator [Jiangella alba]SEF11894.1 Lrp/AsnC family transcriptional regulator, regulator for asnA, asnC and gidA [Jiangella alba]
MVNGSRPQQVELDEIDKAIIRVLQVDGRIAYSKLGPQVGLSRAAARQRVQRLIDSGAIEVVAVSEPLKMGFDVQAMIGINVDGDLQEVASALAAVEEVVYVVLSAGRYDILVEVLGRDPGELLRILNDVIRRTPGVRSTELFTYLKIEKVTYSWGAV